MSTNIGKVLPGFESLNVNTSIHRSPHMRDSSAHDDPKLIVLCSWGWALRKYISKYTDGYQKQCPRSDILLVESEKADFVWRSRAAQRRRLGPAVEVIKATLKQHDLEDTAMSLPPILLVAMSDGGCNSTINLALLLQQALRIEAMPIRALVLDSCPNTPHLGRAYRAFTLKLPNALIPRLLGSLAAYILLSLFVLFQVLGSRSQFNVNSEAMNSEHFVAKSCPRVYIYSEADQITGKEIVEKHADEAEAAGYAVKRALFKRSAHCAHLMEDREKYWGAVKTAWDDGTRTGKERQGEVGRHIEIDT